MTTRCPITLVDAGGLSDQIIRTLAADDEITVIVTGVGPDPGSDDPGLQVIYRLGTTFPGWLTSASTRRVGIVTLTDLTRTLIDFDRPASAPPPLTVDGSPLAVYPAELTIDGVEAMLRSVAALSDAIPAAYLILGSMGAVGGGRRSGQPAPPPAAAVPADVDRVGFAVVSHAADRGRALGAQQHAGARPRPGGRGRLGDRHRRRACCSAGCWPCRP